jgi:hypothetical protein
MKEQKKLTAIYQLYAIGGIIFLLLGIVAAKVMIPSSFEIVVNYWTSNPLLSSVNTVFAPASHVLFSIEFRWALVLLMVLSLVSPAYYVYLVSNNVKNIDFHKYRFLDWTITSSLILLITLTLAGVQDLMTLITLIVLNVVSYCIFWVTNNDFGINPKFEKAMYIVGVICNLLPLILIAVYAICTLVYGQVRSPGFVYFIYAVLIASSIIPIYGYYWHKAQRALKKPTISEFTYPILANQIIKVAFAITLIIGLKR